MSLDPDSLDIGIATATYHDMLQMVDDEKKLRKNLLEWVCNAFIYFLDNIIEDFLNSMHMSQMCV